MIMNLVSTSRKVTGFLVLCALITGMASCNSKEEGPAPVSGTTLKVHVTGIEEMAKAVGTASATAKLMAAPKGTGAAQAPKSPGKIISLGDVDAIVDFESNVRPSKTVSLAANTPSGAAEAATDSAALPKTMSSNGPSTNGLVAAASPVTTGVKFRLLMYDAAGVLKVNQVITSGTDPLLAVDGGVTYSWYTVSVNDADEVPDINGAGVIPSSALANKDVLYASGEITTVDGANNLDVLFKRKTARIQVSLNVIGLFGTINDGTSVSVVKNSEEANMIQMGDLNIRTGAFSNVVEVNTPVLASDMVDDPEVEFEGPGTMKIANFYTVNESPISAGNFKVRINELRITLDNGRERVFEPKTYTYTNAYTPTAGTTHLLNVRLIESAVTVNGTRWARSNLIYNNTDDRSAARPYRFNSNYGETTVNENASHSAYWNWGAGLPMASSNGVTQEPCPAVYPENTWRMPTRAEWESLGQPDQQLEEDLTAIGGGPGNFIFKWNRDAGSPVNSAYDTDDLAIAFGGYRSTSGNLVEVPPGTIAEVLLKSGHGEFHYWTLTAAGSGQAYAAKASFLQQITTPDAPNIYNFSALSVVPANVSEGRNIRCVRAN